MSLLNRRLSRIEAVINPPPSPPIVLIDEPPMDAEPSVRDAFRQQLQEGIAAGWKMIVCRGAVFEKWADEYGCEVMGRAAAVMRKLSLEASTTGRKTALDDLLNAKGTSTIGVTGPAIGK